MHEVHCAGVGRTGARSRGAHSRLPSERGQLETLSCLPGLNGELTARLGICWPEALDRTEERGAARVDAVITHQW